MAFVLTPAPSPTRWVTADLGGGNSLDLQFRRPSFGEMLQSDSYRAMARTPDDAEVTATAAEFRLRTCVVGWRGVTDPDGNDVPFSWEAFQAAAGQSRLLLLSAMLEARRLFAPQLSEGERKNFDTPVLDSSAAAMSPQSTGETQSGCGSASSPQADSPAASAAGA